MSNAIITILTLSISGSLIALLLLISKACEFSCDEAVIRNMSDDEKQRYGNTLLALAANKKFPIGILATTLGEEKNVLKERLLNIMKYKKKTKWAVILMLALALLATGCAAALGPAQNSDDAISEGGKGFNSPVTAYSRTRSGELVNWNDNGCSYTLDENGNVILSYDNGKLTAKAPVTLQKSGSNYNLGPGVDEAGFLISKEITAIAYGGLNGTEPINILISDDMGQTWSSSSIKLDGIGVSGLNIGFTSENNGWLIVSNFHGMGSENHYFYKTEDGGNTWTAVDGNINDVYGRVLSGAGFATKDIGFLCFRYDTDFQPAVLMTEDGGQRWVKVNIDMPKEFDEYNKQPLSPLFDDANGVLPIMLTNANGDVGPIYLVSNDYGKTWKYDKSFSINK